MEYSRPGTRLPKAPRDKVHWKRAIVILEHCPLEQIQTGKGGWELLSDKHKRTLAERNIDPSEFRPDVVHQCLLHLLDCPLNRAGMLQIFLRTHKGVLLAVDPRLRVPRSPRLFSRMMASLLYKLKIRASHATSRITLIKVIPNPITDHLPSNTKFIRVEKDGNLVEPFAFCAGLAKESTANMKSSHIGTNGVSDMFAHKRHRAENAEKAVASDESDASSDDDEIPVWDREETARGTDANDGFAPFAFVVGGMAKGDLSVDYASKSSTIRLSNRGMSAAAVVSLICHGFEEAWINCVPS
jgi:rRNA small subunit pseudouridine methyltransferase Nep1